MDNQYIVSCIMALSVGFVLLSDVQSHGKNMEYISIHHRRRPCRRILVLRTSDSFIIHFIHTRSVTFLVVLQLESYKMCRKLHYTFTRPWKVKNDPIFFFFFFFCQWLQCTTAFYPVYSFEKTKAIIFITRT